ncbi:EAL domain-containing response regulator [Imhoffiella purpurea]|uniref:Uncharacterized protein n=1 Tax=Imhoffiella purpurea TaxID=1249627 RepID=W9VGI1_9GAMM|nr:EAL domain-containing protein [Imhoffiella purpurea]EXJ15147.1 hypothetical protein D779_1701 [Imhoffiella purpurea]
MSSDPASDDVAVIHFLTSDEALASALAGVLDEYGVSLQVHRDEPPVFAEASGRLALLLLDTRRVEGPDALQETVSAILTDPASGIRLVVLAHIEDIRLRLASMRAGADAYLPLDSNVADLAERLVQILGVQAPRPDRILVVDDQPVAALFAARVLEGAGMVTERVLDPLRVMEVLERFPPDLILMDLHMPGASGIELTAVIRAQERYADIPILFLSSELDPDQQMAALRIGGDDFLAKPVAPDRLVACVRNRLARVRMRLHAIHAPESIDGLTRLGTRERLLKRLDRLIGQIHSGAGATAGRLAGGHPGVQRALVYLQVVGEGPGLELVAAKVAAEMVPGDCAARVADHAVAVLIHRQNAGSLAEFAQGLAHEIAQELKRSAPDARLGAGWYPLIDDCQDSVTLLSRASKAAHWSLRGGDRHLGEYDARETARQDGLDRVGMIVEAILADQMQILYEPMVALAGMMGERYELCPRVLVGDGELLAPGEFMPVAARAQLSSRLDRWVLTAGLEALQRRWRQGRPVQLFIHQSSEGMAGEGWTGWLRDQINDRDLIRLRPVIQLEAADADRNLELVIRRTRQLAKLGIRVCLNGIDFSEQSSRVLQALSCSFVRITRRVVQGPELDAIAWLIQSVKASGARVIATGVDGPGTIARLYSSGVDLIQGPYVQPPSSDMAFDFAVAEASEV